MYRAQKALPYTNNIHLLPTTVILQTDDLQTSQLYDAPSPTTRHMNPRQDFTVISYTGTYRRPLQSAARRTGTRLTTFGGDPI
jgi:hypothetical protein